MLGWGLAANSDEGIMDRVYSDQRVVAGSNKIVLEGARQDHAAGDETES